MIRNLDRKTANQLCSRTYEDKGSGGGRKDSIQKKDEMLHSPNEADALAFYLHLLREKGIYSKLEGQAVTQNRQEFTKVVEGYDWDADTENTYQDYLLDVTS